MLTGASSLEETLRTNASLIETNLDSGTSRLSDILTHHAETLNRNFASTTELIGETLQAKANLVEAHLDNSTGRLATMFDGQGPELAKNLESMVETIEMTIRSQTGSLEAAMVERGLSLAELISSRINQANEAFGHCLGKLCNPDG